MAYRGVARSITVGGQLQGEPLKGVCRRSPQQGAGAPGHGVKLTEAENFLVLVHP